jgi:hypothetical protein
MNCRAFHLKRGTLARRDVMYQYIGRSEQSVELDSITCGLKVKGNAGFIRIEVKEETTCLGIYVIVNERPTPTGAVTRWRFNLDYFSPQQRHQLGRESRRDPVTAFDDANAVEGQTFHRFSNTTFVSEHEYVPLTSPWQ